MKQILQTIRNLKRNKLVSIINLLGTTISLSSCLVIFFYITTEKKFDQYIPDKEHKYFVYGNNFDAVNYQINQPYKFISRFNKKLPGVEDVSFISYNTQNLKIEGHKFKDKLLYADTNSIDFLGWKLVAGDPDNILRDKMTMLISKKAAEKFYGDANKAIGKVVNQEDNFKFVITGVYDYDEDHSTITSDFIMSRASLMDINSNLLSNMGNFSSMLMIKTQSQFNVKNTEAKLTELWNNNGEGGGSTGENVHIKLHPFTELHLNTNDILAGIAFLNTGDESSLIIISIAGLLIALIACFNFINLSTVVNSERGVEVGLKKYLGAHKIDIIRSFMSDTFFLMVVSMLLSIAVVYSLLPFLSDWFGKTIEFEIFTPEAGLFLLSILIFMWVLTSLYPAVMLSKKNTKLLNTSRFDLLSKNASGRNILVVVQFVFPTVLIICTIVFNQQIRFSRNQNLGFKKENILAIENPWTDNSDLEKRFQLFRQQADKIPEVEMVTGGTNVPSDGLWNYGSPYLAENHEKRVGNTAFVAIKPNYFEALGAQIIDRIDDFEKYSNDSSYVIANKTFVDRMGDPGLLGKLLSDLWDGKQRRVIAVVEDIQFNSSHDLIKPCIFFTAHRWMPNNTRIIVKLNTNNIQKTVAQIKDAWETVIPQYPFSYFFIDQKYDRLYRSEISLMKVVNIFSLISIVLCSMGLFALSFFISKARTKEIGIRKVNGAQLWQLVYLLDRDLLKWVLAGFATACPIAWYVMQNWLEQYAYKIELSLWVFAFTGIIVTVVALATVSWQTWLAASRNPVKALRYE